MVEVQRTIDRVTDRSRIVELDIHGTINKHIMALKQREAELVSKVEQIRGVSFEHLIFYPNNINKTLLNLRMV